MSEEKATATGILNGEDKAAHCGHIRHMDNYTKIFGANKRQSCVATLSFQGNINSILPFCKTICKVS